MNDSLNKHIKILIVEDEAVTAIYLKNKLVPLGYTVLYPVAKGEEAVVTAQKNKPDVILMDIRLANKMDGIEASKKIFSVYDPKLIFMTAYNDRELLDRANQLPHSGFIIKPVSIEDITGILNTVIH